MSRTPRAPHDDARRRGLSRVAPVTAGIALTGGLVSVSTAVGLAATRDTPGQGGASGTTSTSGVSAGDTTADVAPPPPGDNRRRGVDAPPPGLGPLDGGGIAPGGDNPPAARSQGS